MKRIIKLYNKYHLGDQIFSFILFYNIKKYIEDNEIFIDYYCENMYHAQLSEFNCSENIRILNIDELGEGGQNIWINNQEFTNNHNKNCIEQHEHFDIFYVKFFNEFLVKQNIPIIIETLEYTDPNLHERYNTLDAKHKGKYSNVDYLILNSNPFSGQYNKNDNEWNDFIKKLGLNHKIITTEKVEGVPSTRDDNLTIKDIASVSTRTKNIIAINSGVVPGLFNSYTLNNVEVIYFFDDVVRYKQPKFKRLVRLDELNFLVHNPETFQNMGLVNSNITAITVSFFFIAMFTIFYNNISRPFRHLKKQFSISNKRKL